MKHSAFDIPSTTLVKDALLCDDNTRVSVSPMKAV